MSGAFLGAQAVVVVPQNQILRVILWGLFDHCWQNGTMGALLGSSALSQSPGAIPSPVRGLKPQGWWAQSGWHCQPLLLALQVLRVLNPAGNWYKRGLSRQKHLKLSYPLEE